MRVKIKSLVHIEGEEELVIIPVTKKGSYILAINFYEDVPEGRALRLVIVYDKYDTVPLDTFSFIKGKKTYVDAEGVEEAIKLISSVIRVEKRVPMYSLPFFFDIEVLNEVDANVRGVKGFINYVNKYGNIDINKLKNLVPLEIIES
ncbi:MAG: hypothetical protein OWQ54_01465 [Sulfolobaceae archaeon]|nr:hypothetical protein [Sulfolobaceae archaeon]